MRVRRSGRLCHCTEVAALTADPVHAVETTRIRLLEKRADKTEGGRNADRQYLVAP